MRARGEIADDFIPKIPPNLSVDEASSIPLGLATAALGLFTSRPEGVRSYVPPWSGGIGKYSGESIVILGGSSSVGQYGKRSCLEISVPEIDIMQQFNLPNWRVSLQ